jgi:Holliday junction DNA helicase RuvA
MLNSLSGTLTYKDDGRVFLQSGEVEWEIWTSRTSSDDLPDVGEEARVFVHLYHRDDQLRLYGFSQAGERDGFLDLLKVEGVGPRQALKILSGVEIHRLVAALDNEDLSFLAGIPGVGAKTAQKILLKLKGKMAAAPAGISVEEDVVTALAGMGFERKAARAAVAAAHRSLRERSNAGVERRGPDRAAGARPGPGAAGEALERELFKLAIAQLAGQEGRP